MRCPATCSTSQPGTASVQYRVSNELSPASADFTDSAVTLLTFRPTDVFSAHKQFIGPHDMNQYIPVNTQLLFQALLCNETH